MRFLGRRKEYQELDSIYKQPQSSILVLYGRRRIGKSYLIKHFASHFPNLCFEGLEEEPTKTQIGHFAKQLAAQIADPLLKRAHFSNWNDVFDYLTIYIQSRKSKKKLVLFFDELPWMACSQNKLMSLLKYYWDNQWSKSNVMLILCGSISSFMIKNVIHSKALYGRVDHEMHLGKLTPDESLLFFKNLRSKNEALQYLLLLGGVPKYLTEIQLDKSFQQNIHRLCFSQNGFLVREYEKIFYSHFKEKKTYGQIIELLAKGPADLKTLSAKLKIPSGGGLKGYLDNLESAGFVTDYLPFNKTAGSKLKRYKLSDEYILFYFKYIRPHQKSIQSLKANQIFHKKILPEWAPWLGLAFEAFCLQNAHYLAQKLGFADEIESFGPFFQREIPGFQIDLIYKRMDKVITLCELKYSKNPITAEVIAQVETKAKKISVPKGYTLEKVLIAPNGVDRSVETCGYFHKIITLDELL